MDQAKGRRFHEPVRFSVNGNAIEVEYLADAGRLLLEQWPLQTIRRRRAMRLVLAALRDERPISDARQAFIDATVELKILKAA